MAGSPTSVLIIDDDLYDDISTDLARGATEELRRQGIGFERVSVPGALEIPVALSCAIESGLFAEGGRHKGCIALGCVIKGETQHNEIVGNESARALLDLGVAHALPVGNGILTVNNRDQAWARASVDGGNKGAHAAKACARLIELKSELARKTKR